MLGPIIAILAGIILVAPLIPAFSKMAGTLKPIGGIVGIIALILGLMGVIGGFTWIALALLLAGIMLSANLIPALSGMANTLKPIGGVVGLAAIILGIVRLF